MIRPRALFCRLFRLGLVIAKCNPKLLQTKEENNSTVFSSNIQPSPPQPGSHYNNGYSAGDEKKYDRQKVAGSFSGKSPFDNGKFDDCINYEVCGEVFCLSKGLYKPSTK